MAGVVQVQTEVENPNGRIAVKAVAPAERMDDGRPVAGFYVRRRYHGDEFMIEKAADFSPKWMRFVDTPPEDWVTTIKSRYPHFDADEAMVEDEPLTAKQRADARRKEMQRPLSMSQVADAERTAKEMVNGRVRDKPQPRV
jgi:hypothetical protein